VLEVLRGDTTFLGTVIKNYYSQFLSQIFEIKATICADYDINLFDDITIQGIKYRVVSIKPNLLNHTNDTIAWEMGEFEFIDTPDDDNDETRDRYDIERPDTPIPYWDTFT
jgi:hypothetical protein